MSELPPSEQPHHRLRLVGARAVSTAELLAVICGQRDPDAGARLLREVGDLSYLAQATAAELSRVDGIGPAVATRIQAALELGRRLTTAVVSDAAPVRTPADAAALLAPAIGDLEQEHLVVLTLNTRNQVLGQHLIYKGSLNSSVVRIAELFRPAIRENAAAIVIGHNHPSGVPDPSPEDVRVTREVCQAGRQLGIELLDHLIVARGRWLSLKERGLGFDG